MSATPPPYDRPHAKWVCGQTECGNACAWGPSPRGACPEAQPCAPILQGGHWKCMRPKVHGGSCDVGPGPHGECGLPPQICAPVPGLRSSRGAFLFTSVATVIGMLAISLASSQRNEILVPGALTTPHAQILREQGTRRCATCHEHGQATLAQWTLAATARLQGHPLVFPASPGQTQTERCLDCHDKTLHRDVAWFPHTVAPAALGDGAEDDARRLACAACHREHHGADHDLTRMTMDQCNHCHQRKATSFADDHPDFGDWPYQRRSRIQFTHAAHQARHFPEQQAEFACVACHQTQAGAIVGVLPFADSCGRCHEAGIRQSFAEGTDVLTLPFLDVELLAEHGLEVGEWPSQAQGDFDGTLTPLMGLLLRADPDTQRARQILGVEFDFFQADPDELEQLEAISDLIWAYKRLLRELAVADVAAMKQRLRAATPTDPLPMSVVDAMVSRLPFREIQQAVDKWFPQLQNELPPIAAAELHDLMLKPPLAVRDDSTCVVAISGDGHDSPFTRAWLELVFALPPQLDAAEHLQAAMRAPGAAGDCLSCHTVDETETGLQINWYGSQPTTSGRLTRFQHAPHLVLPEHQDCAACHRLAVEPDRTVYEGFAFSRGPGEFEPMSRAACAACHNPQTRADQCTLCHGYHVHEHP